MPIVLGGDHSLAAGSVAAAAEWARRSKSLPIGLLWLDAHGDMNTPGTSLSGNVHGMPLAALLGREPAELERLRPRTRLIEKPYSLVLLVETLEEMLAEASSQNLHS